MEKLGGNFLGILELSLLGVIAILILVLSYETIQYKKYVIAKNALFSMGVGMQEGFDKVVTHLNILSQDSLQLKQDSALTDQELVLVREILNMHSKQLHSEKLMKLFERIDKLKEIGDD